MNRPPAEEAPSQRDVGDLPGDVGRSGRSHGALRDLADEADRSGERLDKLARGVALPRGHVDERRVQARDAAGGHDGRADVPDVDEVADRTQGTELDPWREVATASERRRSAAPGRELAGIDGPRALKTRSTTASRPCSAAARTIWVAASLAMP